MAKTCRGSGQAAGGTSARPRHRSWRRRHCRARQQQPGAARGPARARCRPAPAEVRDIRFDAGGGIWMACDHGLLHAAGPDATVHSVPGAPAAAVDSLNLPLTGSCGCTARGNCWATGSRPAGCTPAGTGHRGAAGTAHRRPHRRCRRHLSGQPRPAACMPTDPHTDRIEHYDEEDGLPNTEFSATPPVRLGPYLLAAGTSPARW